MNKKLKNIIPKNKKRLIVILVAIIVMGIIIAGTTIAFEIKYQNKILPNIKIGNLNLSGLTKNEAKVLIDAITTDIEKQGIKIIYKNNNNLYLKIMPSINALKDPDLSREILSFDNEATIESVYSIGRKSTWLKNLITKINTTIYGQELSAQIEINKKYLEELLYQQFAELEQPFLNARPEITWVTKNKYQIKITKEQNGLSFDYQKAIKKLENHLKKLSNAPVEMKKIITYASIIQTDAEKHQDLIKKILATTTPKFTYEKKSWQITKKTLSEMLEFQKKPSGEITAGLDFQLFVNWLKINVTPDVNIEPRDAALELQNGRVIKFIPHSEGQKLNIEKIYSTVNQNILSDNLIFTLPVDTLKPKIITEDVNDLGIKEIIGIGQSNFAGSPKNRRHNIGVGAKALHGVLIKPDEEFSLMSELGEINAEAGYRQELVIKGNETKPEYGGGLCQIGTTVFRAAIHSGLPITERRPHAYNVSYYLQDGKPGMDATIYDPHPDVRFINDTGNYILIQTHIKGNELVFEFWGTKDNRKIEIGEISNWDWVAPPETKYVETLDLPVDEKKCTESAHYGVKASFDYKVTYADGQTKEKTFFSKYRPWQEVCLIGVEKLSENTTTSTPQ